MVPMIGGCQSWGAYNFIVTFTRICSTSTTRFMAIWKFPWEPWLAGYVPQPWQPWGLPLATRMIHVCTIVSALCVCVCTLCLYDSILICLDKCNLNGSKVCACILLCTPVLRRVVGPGPGQDCGLLRRRVSRNRGRVYS